MEPAVPHAGRRRRRPGGRDRRSRSCINQQHAFWTQHAVPLLCLVGLVVWPAAIAICRGYRRNRIGIGFDEPGAVIRAGMLVVVAVALPAGFMAVPTGALNPTGDTYVHAVRVTEACCDRDSIRGTA